MGSIPSANDGSIERADLDGRTARSSFRRVSPITPKQIHLDKKNGKLYWCDREGMRVMRANLDGSQVETLVETGRGDADRSRPDQVVRRHHDRSRAQTDLLDAKRPRQRRSSAESSAPASKSRKARRRPIAPTSKSVFDRFAGADRSRARSQESRALLDRSRRSSARQHGQSGIHRCEPHSVTRRRSC